MTDGHRLLAFDPILHPAGQRAYCRGVGQGLVGGPLGGVLTIALVTLMLGVALSGVFCQREIGLAGRWLVTRIRRPPETPTNRPIERIAHDVSRLRAKLLTLDADIPMQRRIGVLQAYDDLLAEACGVLDVPDTLTDLPLGMERDAERLRVEDELAAAGLRLGHAPGG